MLELQVRHSILNVHEIDEENEIEIQNLTYDVSNWLSIDQTKQLIEFLTKQIEGKKVVTDSTSIK
jgi:hypothetical protein